MGTGRRLRVASLGVVEYGRALELQTALVAARLGGQCDDTLLLLEHESVYTLGRGADERFLLDPPAGVPVFRVGRGGQVTWHGPGQLVGYPILKLEGGARDVGRYLRSLEQVLIDALKRCGIAAERRVGFTGVWANGRKLASIGVGIRRWTTFHGFALNVAPDLGCFDAIVPCGIEGCEMTSVAALGHSEIDVATAADLCAQSFAAVFGYQASDKIPSAEIWAWLTQSSAEPQHPDP